MLSQTFQTSERFRNAPTDVSPLMMENGISDQDKLK